MSMITCAGCGQSYDESLVECPKCGMSHVSVSLVDEGADAQPVDDAPSVADSSPIADAPSVAEEKNAERKGRGPGWLWWLLTLVLMVLAVGGTYWLTKRHVLSHLPPVEPQEVVDTVYVSVERASHDMQGSLRVLRIGYPNSDDGFVNVRTSPHADAEVVAQMTGVELMGNAVVLERQGAWDRVQCQGKTGYAYAKYISYQCWYTGKGDRKMVAVTTTPIYFSSQKDDMTHGAQLATVEAGTIIGDKFDSAGADSYVIVERGKYYYLANGMQGYYIPKRTVTIESNL